MKKIYFFLAYLPFISLAQTWSDDVAEIVYDKCSGCHRSGGIAPFSLINYTEVSSMSSAIYNSVVTKKMPPFPPDENYQQYTHSKSLSASQKNTLETWLTSGTPEGIAANTPPPPIFNDGPMLGTGDLTLQMPTYMSKANGGSDDYSCFSLPTGLTQNRTIRAIEIIPGNREIVHHALIYVDPSGTYPTDTLDGDCAGPTSGTLITGFTPGASPIVFPSGAGFKLGIPLPAGSNIVFAMHYPEGSYGQYDSTKVILHFYPLSETGIRQVFAAPVLENWSIALSPNEQETYNDVYPDAGGIMADISILSVFPHMHLVGTKIKAFGVTPSEDTLKFVDVPHWDFHWQDFYFFKNIIKAPVGSKLYGEAYYDNTNANPHNPSNPPQWVFAGESTRDEMMLVYFHFMQYQPGDELYDMESLMNLGLQDLIQKNKDWEIYPVPFSTSVKINPKNMKAGSTCSIIIYDLQGKVIRHLTNNQVVDFGFSGFIWDGNNDIGSNVGPGTYLISMNNDGEYSSEMVVKK